MPNKYRGSQHSALISRDVNIQARDLCTDSRKTTCCKPLTLNFLNEQVYNPVEVKKCLASMVANDRLKETSTIYHHQLTVDS